MIREDRNLAAIYVKPATSESLIVFRPEKLTRDDAESISAAAAKASPDTHRVILGEPQRIPGSGLPVLPFSEHVFINGANEATVVAIASLDSISGSVVGMNAANENELFKSGLPIVFVVDQAGDAYFHPDPQVAASRRQMNDLKIVQEWQESGVQVESALVPFTAMHDGTSYEMIGAYSTADIGDGHKFGVITMQDESKALASVAEMRSRVWLISLGFAIFALLAGTLATRFMTAPLLHLAEAAKKIGAGDYSKRVDTRNRTEIGELAETFNVMTERVEEQIIALAKAAQENRELFVGTVKALAAAIDGKDKYTRGHSERVSRISVAIGQRMGMPEDELETLRMSALLHDIGKIAIDDAILKKPSALTDQEFEIMKTHPQRGYKIMSQIPAMKDFLPGMYMHHEMVNGEGYPQGLTGEQIPLQAKIVSVADTFDAMTIDRPYQKGMDLPAALARLRSFVGTRYESNVVEALVEACNAGEVANGIVRQLAGIRAAEAAAARAGGEEVPSPRSQDPSRGGEEVAEAVEEEEMEDVEAVKLVA
jgi:HD-GYP domain-containing protein (c-di-GMP phosphodiesterase class II)